MFVWHMVSHKHLPEGHSDTTRPHLPPNDRPRICTEYLMVHFNCAYVINIFIYPSFCYSLYSVFIIVQFQDTDLHICLVTKVYMEDILSLS
jgi:hypothetical protein